MNRKWTYLERYLYDQTGITPRGVKAVVENMLFLVWSGLTLGVLWIVVVSIWGGE